MITESILHANENRTHHWGFRVWDKVLIKTTNTLALVIWFNLWSSNGLYIEDLKWRRCIVSTNLEMVTRIEDQKYQKEILNAIKFNS